MNNKINHTDGAAPGDSVIQGSDIQQQAQRRTRTCDTAQPAKELCGQLTLKE